MSKDISSQGEIILPRQLPVVWSYCFNFACSVSSSSPTKDRLATPIFPSLLHLFPSPHPPSPTRRLGLKEYEKGLEMKSSFPKGSKSTFGQNELLVEYSRVSKTTHFDTNFISLAYLILKLRSLAISGIFRKILDF